MTRKLKRVVYVGRAARFEDSGCETHECVRPPIHLNYGVGHVCACGVVFWSTDDPAFDAH